MDTMEKVTYWSDKEWAAFLGVSSRTARKYFKEGIIHGAEKTPQGEWQADSNGLTRYLSFRNLALASNWKSDEDGGFIDPRLGKDLKRCFKPMFDASRETILREANSLRVASALTRSLRQLPFEESMLDAFEEATRWKLASPSPYKLSEMLEGYLPTKPATKLIMGFFDLGQMERAEILVAMTSAINIDGKRRSGQLPSTYDEWAKIRGRRPTGQYFVTHKKGDTYFNVETKPNKSSNRRFKNLLAKYNREKLTREAYGLHPDNSDILGQYHDQCCHEGAAHWSIEAYKAMDF